MMCIESRDRIGKCTLHCSNCWKERVEEMERDPGHDAVVKTQKEVFQVEAVEIT